MTGVQNSILIQNVLANNTEDKECPDEDGSGGGKIACWSEIADGTGTVVLCSSCAAIKGTANGGKGTCK